jgi:pimeloyl-ACP methyl ester carboxylesterase
LYVPIGGIDQWIQFADGPPGRPILLYLHGGPGGTSVPVSAAWKAWEAHFTVVHWDQRGAGRTFARNGEKGCGPLTLERMIGDALEVAEFLIAQLRRPRVLLVGHSWGSALGVHMLKRRPELFSAFVGTGQLVNMLENERFNYRRQMEQAERLGDLDILEALREIGPPPYTNWTLLQRVREWADRTAEGDGDPVHPQPNPIAPDFRQEEVPLMIKGAEFSRRQLLRDLNAIDLPALGFTFGMPMFFFHGTHDHCTPMALAERYFASIVAPQKGFVRFEGCHHFVVMNRPDDFLRELVARVRPLLEE